jgi:hypothetical protein
MKEGIMSVLAPLLAGGLPPRELVAGLPGDYLTALKLLVTFPPLRQVAEHLTEAVEVAAALDQIATTIQAWRTAWEAHPDYRLGSAEPVVLAQFRHPPGHQKQEYSWLIGGISDMLGQLAWAQRTLGEPVRLGPILPEFPVDPYFTTAWSASYLGSGRAYHARLALKALLPGSYRGVKFRPLINNVRSWVAQPKVAFLDKDPTVLCLPDDLPEHLRSGLHPGRGTYTRLTSGRWSGAGEVRRYKPRELLPGWWFKTSKGELWLRYVLTDEQRRAIATFMDPLDFWRCASGEVHPDEVKDYLVHAPSFESVLSEVAAAEWAEAVGSRIPLIAVESVPIRSTPPPQIIPVTQIAFIDERMIEGT